MDHLTSVPFDFQPTFPDFLLNGKHPNSLRARLHRTLFIAVSDPFTIQYNTIFILPYTTFTDGKKKMKKIDDRE